MATMAKPKPSFTVTCPCCGARLTLDSELGAVIAHEEAPRPRETASLGDAFSKLVNKSAEREERFRQQIRAEADKGKLLDRKFQESLRKAKDSPDPPRRRYDYD